ncbi:MAG TPA: mandelate racemase/muconate lactonizing enzyme family protein [Methylomirabilota bacterium]|nr:mandelate racemase/muconate lactonizing enzyme family protein [Methylomirabilota bacterium]
MKVERVRTYHLRAELGPAERFAYSQAWVGARTAMLVELVADDGRSGWGEAYGPPAPSKTIVDELYAPRLVGRDPLDSTVIWEECYAALRDYGRTGFPVAALSAVDIALWDLKGQALGQPVHKLLGGPFRSQLTAYATGLYRHDVPDQTRALAKEARGYVAEGFRAMKLKVGFGVEEDVRNVRAVREAIGPERRLMVDANHAYDAMTAIRLGRLIEPHDIGWFEEPVVPEDLAGYLQVRAALRTPISGGEAEYARFGFRELCARRCVDILQPDICACGGFTEALRIAALASTWGVTVYPHVWGSAVGLHASLQWAAALPPNPAALMGGELWFELDRTPNPFREHLAVEPPKRVGDIIDIPQRPGLGLEVDRRLLEKYQAP